MLVKVTALSTLSILSTSSPIDLEHSHFLPTNSQYLSASPIPFWAESVTSHRVYASPIPFWAELVTSHRVYASRTDIRVEVEVAVLGSRP